MNFSIFKPSNRKFYSIEFQDIGGKLVRKSTKRESKREAQSLALEIINQHNEKLSNGDLISVGSIPKLSVLFNRVMKDRWSQQKDSKTVQGRINGILEILGDIPINEITPEASLKLTNSLLANGRAKATCNRYVACLKTALRDACNIYMLIPSVPHLKLHKEDNKKTRFLDKSEESLILEVCPRQDMRDLLVVLLDTGVRLSEALRLGNSSINLLTESITIWGEEQKGNRSRTLSMTNRVKEVIERTSKGNTEKPFKLTLSNAERIWKIIKKKLPASMKDVTLHTMRHTCASRLVQSGVSIYVVQEILGHSSSITTERYAHLNSEAVKNAILKLN